MIRLTCPRCKTCFRTDAVEVVECENCGTRIRPKRRADEVSGIAAAISTFERWVRETAGLPAK
jgi:DNA-directed RNA polymerase subunit RPC12/RpoP